MIRCVEGNSHMILNIKTSVFHLKYKQNKTENGRCPYYSASLYLLSKIIGERSREGMNYVEHRSFQGSEIIVDDTIAVDAVIIYLVTLFQTINFS